MTYVALDEYVRRGGRLGFLITQAVFKTGGAEGFRRFQLPDDTPLAVVHVDDMSELKPFAGAANRTAIVVLQRDRENRYPVPYVFWRGRGHTVSIGEDLTLEEAAEITTRASFVAQPVDKFDLTSPWLTARRRVIGPLQRLLGASPYQARAGVCTWLNGVYWLEIVEERPDDLIVVTNLVGAGKKKIRSEQAAIEPGLVYPLLRARDVGRWEARPSASILLPHTRETSWRAIDESEVRTKYPKTYRYLAQFREELLRRSGYRLLRQGHPFYILGDVHTETFAPYKVVWSNIASELAAAVVGAQDGKTIVPQHIVTMVAFRVLEEAHFVCAMLNNVAANVALASYSQKGGKSFGTPHVLRNIAVPLYEKRDAQHKELARLSEDAHEATLAGDTARVKEIEDEIDQLAAELWGLTPHELSDIKRSLEELS
jgi:hypothetical protein